MAIFNYAAREMTAKIVYYGPGLSGKTTSIQYIHSKISPKSKGKLVSLATETDRTLFFDFFPVEFGSIGGFKVKFNFYTVPGQVFYNTTRKLVLKGADGVVFVGDSQPGMMEQNLESLENLRENLKAHGIDWETVPFAIQYNKRDLPSVLPVEEMRRKLNTRSVPDFETSATTGLGIMETMKAICKLVLEDIQKKQKRSAKDARPKESPAAAAEGVRTAAPPPSGAPQPPPQPRPAPPAPTATAAPKSAPERTPSSGGIRSENASSVERSVVIPFSGPGSTSLALSLPLELQVQEGVQAVQVSVQVQVSYLTDGPGEVIVRELSAEPTSAQQEDPGSAMPEPERKRGFFARLFGGG